MKRGLAIESSSHEFGISSHDSFPSFSWEVPFLLGFYIIPFSPPDSDNVSQPSQNTLSYLQAKYAYFYPEV